MLNSDTVILGLLIDKREDRNRYFYEFELNGTKFEGFSVIKLESTLAYQQLEVRRNTFSKISSQHKAFVGIIL